jgi:dTDP-4-dehydrorhamnose 3,5-epimerase
MERLDTKLDGLLLLKPRVFGDDRGFFMESYRRSAFTDLGIAEEMVQDNHSRSAHGVVRGMHFQIGAGTSKLIRCGRGAIWDVVVDIRRGSPTWGRWEAFTLDDERLLQLFIPVGFAHGFCVVSEVADVLYGCSSYYDGSLERGFAWDDPDVAVPWPAEEPVVSARDVAAPRLREIAEAIPFAWDPEAERSRAASSSAR